MAFEDGRDAGGERRGFGRERQRDRGTEDDGKNSKGRSLLAGDSERSWSSYAEHRLQAGSYDRVVLMKEGAFHHASSSGITRAGSTPVSF
jgi:hypothetical protein